MGSSGLIAFAAVYIVFVVTPGPGVAAIVARGLGSGLRHAVPFSLGFVLGDLTWFTVAATGLAAVATHFHLAFAVLKYGGCAYLAYLAWKIWTAPVEAGDVGASSAQTGAWSSFAGSLSLTLSNPKVIVFFVSIMPLVVDVHEVSFAAYLQMATILAAICFTSDMTYLYLAGQARRVFRSTSALKRINRGSAGLMAGAAALIAARG